MLITASIEAGFVEHFQLKGAHADKMKGRSKVRITPNMPTQAPQVGTPEHDTK